MNSRGSTARTGASRGGSRTGSRGKSREVNVPKGYDPGRENTSEGYALVVTNFNFPIGKWTAIDNATDRDHSTLSSLLPDHLICKFRSENLVTLRNTTTMEFQKTLEGLADRCPESGFLTIYLSTHIVTAKKGDRKNKKERSFLAFSNSVWGSPAEIGESCISLTEFSVLLNNIPCKKKTIILNLAHIPKPRTSFFSASRAQYPHENTMTRLATLSNSVVIGSCTIGTSAVDHINHTPNELAVVDDRKKTKYSDFLSSNSTISKTISRSSKRPITPISVQSVEKENEGFSILSPRFFKEGKRTSQEFDELLMKLVKEWNLAPIEEIFKTKRPEEPRVQWERNASTGYAIDIQLPDKNEINQYSGRLRRWRIRRALAGPGNLIKKHLRKRRKRNLRSPCQISKVENNLTVFGRAVINAFRGGACRPDSPVVTAGDLFAFIAQRMRTENEYILQQKQNFEQQQVQEQQNSVVENNPNHSSVMSVLSDDDVFSGTGRGSVNLDFQIQNPVIYLPHSAGNGMKSKAAAALASELLRNPVCYRCGPPAAPFRPYIIKVDDNGILLEWYNQPFDGIPPIKYKIAMRNKTRNFNSWQDIYYPGDITKSRFYVRNLPFGVACQFKVAGYNNGGWGRYSEETLHVTPGEEKTVITEESRWKKLRKGGVLAVMDRLDEVPLLLSDYRIGLKMLVSFGQTDGGFGDLNIVLRVSKTALHGLKTFTEQNEIISFCFVLIGCCLKGSYERKVRHFLLQNKLNHIVESIITTYRMDSKVINSYSFLCGKMGKYLPAIPAYNFKTLFPKEGEEKEEVMDDSGTDSDDEDNKENDNADEGDCQSVISADSKRDLNVSKSSKKVGLLF